MTAARSSALRTLLLLALAAGAAPVAAADDSWRWIRGFEITPGAGLRYLSVNVHDKAAGTQGNLSNSLGRSLFGAISVESPGYQFGGSNFGASVYLYAADVRLNEQLIAEPGMDPGATSISGTRQDVGTRLTGYYSYLVPALHYRLQGRDGSTTKFALGYGPWYGRFSGDVILTPDNRPSTGLPRTSIDTRLWKTAFLFSVQFKFASHWQAYMTVGGPKWQDDSLRYEMEQISLVLGYTFIL